MDDIERAQLETDRHLVSELNKIINIKVIEPTGNCLNCKEPLEIASGSEPKPRWCDAECRDDWDKREQKQ